MILPIVGYGHPALREDNEEITADYPALGEFIENMFETMYNAQGVGLAAPQVGVSIRLFVVDGTPMEDMKEKGEGSMLDFKKVFINPQILEESGTPWVFEEGCLSIPDIRENVSRQGDILIKYYDAEFVEKTERFTGLKARIIQHEYDHLEGVLFTDHISNMRRRMLKARLNKIVRGEINNSYPMRFHSRVR